MGKRASDKAAGTTLIAVRVPVALLAKVDAAGKRTDVVLQALERMLSGSNDEQARQAVEEFAARLGVKL